MEGGRAGGKTPSCLEETDRCPINSPGGEIGSLDYDKKEE